jgi:two-component system chemotaxis sensor kinase CheA
LLSKIGALKKLTRIDRMVAAPQASPGLAKQIEHLVAQVASDEGKQVKAQLSLESVADIKPEQMALCSEIVTQLVRNAVVHGIEPAPQRLALGKAEQGLVEVGFWVDAIGNVELTVKDDGAGLSADKVRQKLLDLGWYGADDLAQLSDRQVMAHIFKPGFTTAAGEGMHAGRGVGLDVVQANVERLGGQLMVSTKAQDHTVFRIRFGA